MGCSLFDRLRKKLCGLNQSCRGGASVLDLPLVLVLDFFDFEGRGARTPAHLPFFATQKLIVACV